MCLCVRVYDCIGRPITTEECSNVTNSVWCADVRCCGVVWCGVCVGRPRPRRR